MEKNRKRYFYLAIITSMILLAGCAARSQPASVPESSSVSSNEASVKESSSEETESASSETPQSTSKEANQIESSSEPEASSENETAGNAENIPAGEFFADFVDMDGNPIGNSMVLSIRLPDSWTADGNIIYNEDKRKIAEVLPCIMTEDNTAFDKLAEKYPDGDPRDVTIGKLSGKCYYSQTEITEGEFAGTFHNELVYYFKIQDDLYEGFYLIGIKFYPAFGGGIGPQREAFQSAIQIGNWHKMI